MPISTDLLSKTTEGIPECDVFSDVLKTMHISGSTLLNEDYVSPWALAIPDTDLTGAILNLNPDTRAIVFHLVKQGYIEMILPQEQTVIVEAGELAICFGGSEHQVGQGSGVPPLKVEKLLFGGNNPFQPQEQTVRSTSLICGVFLIHHFKLNPLLAALPPLLHTSVQRFNGLHNLSVIAELMTQEIDRKKAGSDYVVDRLLELTCAEAIRFYLESLPPQSTGWLTGLRDPVISRALAMIHAQPGHNWTVSNLAEGVMMSPSRFAARFGSAIGKSPMAYVTTWRMNIAARLLASRQQDINAIAAQVGYASLPAFNRSFKRHLGFPPAAWRSRHYS
ncbi:MAG: AraC family transcriptional regulator [Chroococcidiopsidaceae cyanobacterium CP_BM_RX_35]|nr:AraC family transcriptional regulator [Chroococcidiopsidaceae cyanobacterium CP_BM_RX_35]